MSSVIHPDNTWALWAIIVSWVAISIRLEQRHRWAAKISGPVLVLLGAVVLSNIPVGFEKIGEKVTRVSIIPIKSPVYDAISDYIVPVCIPLLLFRANIAAILRQSGWMFLVFHFSAIGTMVGAVIAALTLQGAGLGKLPDLIGIMTGSYTGGSVNFVALSNTFDPPEEYVNSLLVADNLVMTVFFLICFSLTSMPFMRRVFRTPYVERSEKSDAGAGTKASEYWKPKPISLLDIANALAIAVVIAGVSHLFAAAVKESAAPAVVVAVLGQPYLVITTLCVIVASVFHRWLERIAGAEELGTYLIYLFFFIIGAPADVVKIVVEVPVLFVLCAIMALANLLVTLLLTWVFRRNLEEAALAVNATLGGAPSAAAMAIAKGWTPLVLPSILVGIWGYVVGTYMGLAVGKLLAVMLAGGG